MSRPVLLVFLLVVLMVTSQFEWKQQLVNEVETTPGISKLQKQVMDRDEAIKEKIILSQEKTIQRLNDLIQTLQQQLVQCMGNNYTNNESGTSLTPYVNEIIKQQMLED